MKLGELPLAVGFKCQQASDPEGLVRASDLQQRIKASCAAAAEVEGLPAMQPAAVIGVAAEALERLQSLAAECQGQVEEHGLELEPRQALLHVELLRCSAGCGHAGCTNCWGASEASFRGRRCGGCRRMRYCSEECAAVDWERHRPLCVQLPGYKEEDELEDPLAVALVAVRQQLLAAMEAGEPAPAAAAMPE